MKKNSKALHTKRLTKLLPRAHFDRMLRFLLLKNRCCKSEKKNSPAFFSFGFRLRALSFSSFIVYFFFFCRKNYYHVGTHVSSLRLVDDKYFVMQYVQANKQMDKSQQHFVICCFCNQTFQSWFLLENLSLFVCCCCQLRRSRLRKLWPFKTDWHFCYKSEQETWNLLFLSAVYTAKAFKRLLN